jgi:hypothetical protein
VKVTRIDETCLVELVNITVALVTKCRSYCYRVLRDALTKMLHVRELATDPPRITTLPLENPHRAKSSIRVFPATTRFYAYELQAHAKLLAQNKQKADFLNPTSGHKQDVQPGTIPSVTQCTYKVQ